VPDLWSIITGIASIASLLIALGDRFASWRRYLLPVTYALGGFALGRFSFSVGPGVREIASDPTAAAVLVLVLALIAVVAAIAVFLLKKGEAILAYAIVIISLTTILPQVFSFYSKAYDRASSDDYLAIAEVKARSADFTGALRLLEGARRVATSDALRKAIDEQIQFIAGRQLERVKQVGKD
jgi:hypothetical protein